jgi:hypothetical protein
MVHRYVFFSKSNAGFSGLQILFDMFNPARPVVSPEMLLYVFFQNPARVFPDCKFFLICLIQRGPLFLRKCYCMFFFRIQRGFFRIANSF